MSPLSNALALLSLLSFGLSVSACQFQDNCSQETISATPGSSMTDTCGTDWDVGDDCVLTRNGGIERCDYLDGCSNGMIWGKRGGFMTDSCGVRYAVGPDCHLDFVGDGFESLASHHGGNCGFEDACSGADVVGARGGILVDSCDDAYSVSFDCTLRLIGADARALGVGLGPRAPQPSVLDKCAVRDSCSGEWIKVPRSTSFVDSCQATYAVGSDCSMALSSRPPAR